MALKRLYFQNFPGEHAPGPPRGSRAFGASRANSCPPPPLPKFLTPYAYVYLKTNLQCPFPKSEKEEYTSILS